MLHTLPTHGRARGPLCQICGLRLAQRRAAPTSPVPRPGLQVRRAPQAADWRLSIHVAPDAPLGFADVDLGGAGVDPRDPRVYADALRRIANHLRAYAADYETAAQDDGPAAPALPAVYCRACGAAGVLAHDLCPECYDQHEPF